MRVRRPDILVIGGGLTGCAMAVALHRRGFDVLLVERDAQVRERFRGEYLQPAAVGILRDLGFTAITEGPDAIPIREMHFRDLDADQKTVLSEVLIQYGQGTHAVVLPSRKLCLLAQKHALKTLGANFQRGATIRPTNESERDFHLNPVFEATLSDGRAESIRPRWVMGCDGRQSSVRKWMNGRHAPAVGKATLGSKAEFIVGCEIEKGPTGRGRYEVIRTTGRGTLALFQLQGVRQRCYWSTENPGGKRPWSSELTDLLGRVSPITDSYPTSFTNLAGCPADTKWLGPAAHGRFLSAGDALAITTPFGGQGMTCLTHHVQWIARRLTSDTDHSSRSIRQFGRLYERDCRGFFNHISLLNFGLYYLFFGRHPLHKSITRHILNRWNRSPDILERMSRLFGGVDADTPGVLELTKIWGLLPRSVSSQSSIITS